MADRELAGDDLAGAVGGVASRVATAQRVAVWATPSLDTCIAVAGVLAAGGIAIPLDPRSAPAELAHVVNDSRPQLVFAPEFAILPPPVGGLPVAEPRGHLADLPPEPDDSEAPALLMYTSGTTGPPKGVVLSRRAIAASLDGLADAWSWSADDVLVHALPLFHVHGLVLGVLGPLRFGSSLRHPGTFSPAAIADADGTMVFGVPTMWSRIAAEPESAKRLSSARLLVSGSAGLPKPVYDAVLALTGHGLVERYGLTEALIVAGARADQPSAPGSVGRALSGVGIRLADVDEGMGEIELSGPTLFSGYYGRPDATAAVMTSDGWLRSGDLGSLDDDGLLRIVGRRATDLIMTGGHRVGAGEVEAALLAHPAVSEAAVIAEPDDDLGERIVAFVVSDGVDVAVLDAHAAGLLAPYKRPRDIRLVKALPRNAMGKVLKHALRR
ncbi:MAG: fatty acid CoA ligase FadD36 [Frankiales bacterium]|nr:fatty acid CoA ligase FadD36 [Frankiales bacterium]